MDIGIFRGRLHYKRVLNPDFGILVKWKWTFYAACLKGD